MSKPLKLLSASVKTIFTDQGTSYEIATTSPLPEIDSEGIMTWSTEEQFHIEKEGFVCHNAKRPAHPSIHGRLTISFEGNTVHIIDVDGDRTFLGSENLLENFRLEINRIAN